MNLKDLQVNTNLNNKKSEINLAIVLDQLSGAIGGAESILFAVYELFPDAPTYTTILNPSIMPEKYKNKEIYTTLIQNLPFSQKMYKAYFPLMPVAIEHLNLQEYDVIFSSHHCVAKGIIPRPDAVHICYCHAPARYIWDLFWTYSNLNNFGRIKKAIISVLSHYIRIWDVISSNRVDYFLANSKYTAARIKKFYNRESEILYPPVDTNRFNYESSDDYCLMVGRLVAYKGFELAIDAFNESKEKFIIIGDGVEFKKLRAKAGPNIIMPGKVSNEELVKYMNNCKAFIFPGKEDFGIVMAEAQAAGKPVIALKAGGALDIVIDNETGILFEEQTVSALNKAILKAKSINWNYKEIANHSNKFDKEIFINRLKYIIENAKLFERNIPINFKNY
ncbi:MAG: glycosyltransferase [bacterium]